MATDETDKRKLVRVSVDGKTSALRPLGPKRTPQSARPEVHKPLGSKDAASRNRFGKTKSSSLARRDPDPGFFEIEEACWQWAKKNCPRKSTREQVKWMCDNAFAYDGTSWKRSCFGHTSNSGKNKTWTVIYKSTDGRTLSNGQWAPNRRNDPKRNWGLPE